MFGFELFKNRPGQPLNQSNRRNSSEEVKLGYSCGNELRAFLVQHPLDLAVPKRTTTISELRNSPNQRILGDYIICDNYPLGPGSTAVHLAYQTNSPQVLVAKETTTARRQEFAKLNNWQNVSPEEHLQKYPNNHPGLLLPIKTVTDDKQIYRFYESMDMDLEEYLQHHNQLPLHTAVSLCLLIGDSVKRMHDSGVVHADLLPANILLKKNQVKVTDFDNSGMINNESKTTQRMYLGGNRFSMAPELLGEKRIFGKTVDIYALSSMLYRLIVGRWPYDIDKQTKELPHESRMYEYQKIHNSGTVNFPESVSPEIRRVIKKGMSPDPKDRYQTMQEFMSALIHTEQKIELGNKTTRK